MADVPQADNEVLNAKVRRFQEFLDSDLAGAVHEEKLRSMMSRGDSRLLVDVGDLRAYDDKLCSNVLNTPAEYLPAFDKAVAEAVAHLNPEYGKESKAQFSVGFEGDFGSHQVTPRSLNSTKVNKLVAISGIVTKCSLVRPKILKSVHYCEATKQMHQREYRDATSFSGLPTGSTYMTRDDDGNVLTTEYGLCEYTDSQGLHLQEMPEHAEVGQLPRSVDILISNDLVDKVKPGERVQVVGVYKPLAGRAEGVTNGVFRTVIIAVALRSLARHLLQSAMTEKDISNIRKIAQQRNFFDSISSSLAPSICGHDFVKKGLLLLLLGGQEKNLANGTHIRGDINMLLVGDPSVAKSQLLRYVLNVAPLAVSTTGRGSSGVGLTAAVTADSETGEKKLEAGAMVLADRGIVCIDEFDKMSDQDRVAIHEVMEQQTVTIAKAGIHTSLNARCSVVAAANPVYGSYNRQKKTTENIGLPDSLLSRFDLLFILLDTVEEAHDKRISDHVLRVHRYKGKEGEKGLVDEEDEEQEQPDEDEEAETPVYEKYNRNLHGERSHAQQRILTQGFLKKYIRFARRMRPKLGEEASDRISHIYMDLRGSSDIASGALPVTPRTLETLIRLATAHAKCRLSGLVELKDVEAAYDVMMFALTNETPEHRGDRGEEEEEDEDMGEDSDGGDDDDDSSWRPGSGGKGGRGGKKRSREARKKGGEGAQAAAEEEEEEEEEAPRGDGGAGRSGGKRQRRAEGEEGGGSAEGAGSSKAKRRPTVSSERYQNFKTLVDKYFVEELQAAQTDTESAEVQEVLNYVNTKQRGVKYTRGEADVILEGMTDACEVYVSDGCVFRT